MRDAEVGKPERRRDDVVVVQEGLAHPHEDTVVDLLEAPEMERLVENLGRCQVAAELHRPGGAEGAGQRAARL